MKKRTSRAARSGVRRAIGMGLLEERRGPDGLRYVCVSTEGWRSLGGGR